MGFGQRANCASRPTAPFGLSVLDICICSIDPRRPSGVMGRWGCVSHLLKGKTKSANIEDTWTKHALSNCNDSIFSRKKIVKISVFLSRINHNQLSARRL